MVYTFVLGAVVLILFSAALVWLLNSAYSTQLMTLKNLLTEERSSNLRREAQWELERERLLNRAMTKEWTTYAQMTGALSVSSPQADEPAVGMSDLEELRRAGLLDGIGEENFDPHQMAEELGL